MPQAQAPPPLESRISTFLKLHSRENITNNVARNSPWETKRNIQTLESEVVRTYQACESVITGESIPIIARKNNLPISKVSNWRYKDCIPEVLKLHQRSLTPSTIEERVSFAYVLGTYSKSRSKGSGHENPATKGFKITVKDTAAKERILTTARVLLGQNIQAEGDIIYSPSQHLVKVLHYCLHHKFDDYVANGPEKVAYLQGFFDASNLKVLNRKKGNMYYKIQRENNSLLKLSAKLFFELGIFPRISFPNHALYIECFHDLQGLYTLELDLNAQNRAKIAARLLELTPQNHTLRTYYAVRSAVRTQIEQGPISWGKMAQELGGPCPDTIRSWTVDIIRKYDSQFDKGIVTPKMVKRHRELTEFLGIPNIFEDEGSRIKIGENIFFNVGGEVYCLPQKIQQMYAKQAGIKVLDDHLDFFHDQLHNNIQASQNISLEIKVERTGVISSIEPRYPYLNTLEIYCDGKKITFSNAALYDYFTVYGLPAAPLQDEDIEFLQEQYISDGEADLKFKKEGALVTGLSLKNSTSGANRWDMQKNYVDLKLGSERSNLLSVFGFL